MYKFGSAISVRTPFRISFFGGGSDYPQWYSNYGGRFFSAAINRYSYIQCRVLPGFLDYNYRLTYSKIEEVNTRAEIKHPVIKAALDGHGIGLDRVELVHTSDLPGRSGIGSSSTFCVGCINAFSGLQRQFLSKKELFESAVTIERDVLGETVGIQDQFAASYGGINDVRVSREGVLETTQIGVDGMVSKELVHNMFLVFSGYSRFATEIASQFVSDLEKKESVMQELLQLVDPAICAFKKADVKEFGELLTATYDLKRAICDKVRNPSLESFEEKLNSYEVYGYKLLGAGGGGFYLVVAPPETRRCLVQESNVSVVDFEFDEFGAIFNF